MEKTLQQEENSSDSAKPQDTDCWKLMEHFEELLLYAGLVLMQFLRHLLLVTVPKVPKPCPLCLFLYMDSISYRLY